MFIKNSTIKLTFLCSLLLSVSNCANSSDSVTGSANISETKVGVVQITPTPFAGKAAKIKSDYLSVKTAGNLKDSVEQQELPKIWLEFDKENGQILRVDLDDKFDEDLKAAGEALFRYQYVIKHSENPDERYDASYKQLTTFDKTRNKMSKLEIDSPNGKRNLTEGEILEILYKQSGLINDRYEELDDYFYPKTSFYKFKKSVNEKLGYAIF